VLRRALSQGILINLFNKEIDDEKFSKLFGCVFRNFAGGIPTNVKFGRLGKMDGGGGIGVKKEERTIASVHVLNSFPKTSYNVFALHRSVSHLSNFLW
jgi:hypothetical protein